MSKPNAEPNPVKLKVPIQWDQPEQPQFKSPESRKMFLVSFDYEIEETVWRMSDEDLQDFIHGVLRTVAAGHTEGPIPKVVVRIVRDGGEVVCSS